MKVILLRDVAKLGKRFSVAEVPDGYALNQLIPKGMAQAASAENLKRVAARAMVQSTIASSEQADFEKSLTALKGSGVTLTVDANAQGHLFKGVKAVDIATAAAASGHAVPLESIMLLEPIKSVGDHVITLKLAAVNGEIVVHVITK